MYYSRQKIVDTANMCIGINEFSNEHRMILATYNSWAKPHKMYEMTLKDSWCACFVSACFITNGYSNIIPCECSCSRMVAKAKAMGIWYESDEIIPDNGDLILYDWQDTGIGDCKGNPDHIGIVTNVYANVITVVEGNYNDSVKERKIKVNAKYIRGYIKPRYTIS